MKRCLKYLFFCFFVFTVIINSNVKAAPKAIACDYGIVCTYSLPYLSVTAGGHSYANAYLGIYYQCKDNSKKLSECTTFESAAYSSILKYNSQGGVDKVSFNNYDDIFYATDTYKDKFNYNGQFKCPVIFYHGSGGGTANPNVTLYYNKSDAGKDINDYNGATLKDNACISKNTNVDWSKLTDTIDQGAEASPLEMAGSTADEDIRGDSENPEDLGEDAAILDAINKWGNSGDSTRYNQDSVDPCDLISDDIQDLLHNIFFFISVAGIIILVAMTAISLVKVITASEDEALRNFFKGLWKRIICLIILLILPTLVTFIVQLVNNVAPGLGIRSDNPLCNVTE